ncbi:energy-coupling factor ABC transporter ATP-binding protein [Corynebacterium pacaense]|uniref:energy-coupling factor ABC transporter ATP-binding protein n=1 Tax=Corynebacterium pacaense TaxID=1816684 RepID=UPI0009BBD422|nr:ABC transporter ATP-binding protein [Corynebacterium pacaense]
MSEALIEAFDLRFSHEHGTEVLRGTSVRVNPGQILVVLGANGCGKSTLLKVLAGSWRARSGTLKVAGRTMDHSRRDRDRVRRIVQLVLQEPDDQLFSTSVRADVSFGPMNQDLPPARVRELVDAAMRATGVFDLADRVPHQLSYGQRKRVVLAGALAMSPAALLLDEPTAGLDPAGSQALMGVLQRLRGEGRAIVMATHDVDLAYSVADRIAVMDAGVLSIGAPEVIMADRRLLDSASLSVPWALAVSEVVGRPVRTIEDLFGG